MFEGEAREALRETGIQRERERGRNRHLSPPLSPLYFLSFSPLGRGSDAYFVGRSREETYLQYKYDYPSNLSRTYNIDISRVILFPLQADKNAPSEVEGNVTESGTLAPLRLAPFTELYRKITILAVMNQKLLLLL